MKDNQKRIAILAGILLLLLLCGIALALTTCGGSGDVGTATADIGSARTTDESADGATAATTKGNTSVTQVSTFPDATTDKEAGNDTPVTDATTADNGNTPATTTKDGGSTTPATTTASVSTTPATTTTGSNTPVATTTASGGNTTPATTTTANTGTQTPSGGETDSIDGLTITWVSGTKDAYTISGNTVTFNAVSQKTVYAISGTLNGNLVIDVGDDYKFDLELTGVTITSDQTSPITVLSGDEVSITAKNGTKNYIYDNRATVAEDDTTQYAAAIWSQVDLEICGKGVLTVVSENNKGIHTKDDLTVKNLTLSVTCTDNALKGNDSVTIESGITTLIATMGDGIKTDNTDVSDKGNQRGTVEILGGTHNVYAACDGIDAAYNVVIGGDSTVVNIYTDKYSPYSEEVTAVSGNTYYVRYSKQTYKYSVKYTNSDGTYEWVNAVYYTSVRGGQSTYYYYSFPKKSGYEKMTLYMYSSSQTQGQDTSYYAVSSEMTLHDSYDTIAISNRNGSMTLSWTNFTTSSQGGGMGGGMNDGNTDKGDYSTKGIKAGNEIVISGGTVNIEAYDDAIHANGGTALENGSTSTGHVTISGGTLTLSSNDDGVHADGTLTVSGGTVKVTGSYEGLEGNNVRISGGDISIISKDDGINAPATSGEAIVISGGKLYIYAGGDGIDSNSRTSYSGIVFSGGKTVVICTSGGNSAIDTEAGYKYTAGQVIAIMPSGGMTSEATHCSNFSSVATKSTLSLTSGRYLNVTVSGSAVASVKMPTSINSAMAIYLGSKSATLASGTSAAGSVDADGVYWK